MKNLIHTQSIPSITWSITHNFNSKVVVDVFVIVDGVQQKIHPRKITHTSDNSLMIEFSSPRTGGARILAV